MRATLIVLWIAGVAIAGTAEQTDWSGGDGVIGPVMDWGDQFWTDTGINHYGSNLSVLTLPYMEHMIIGNFDGTRTVFSEDVDGDGDMDVLGMAHGPNDVRWWENTDGSGTDWNEHIIDSYFNAANTIWADDLDADGDIDVMGAAVYADQIAVWLNDDGSGTSWTEYTVQSGYNYAYTVCSVDMDGDGDKDLLGTARYGNDVTWWENDDGSATSWTTHTIDGSFDGANSAHFGDLDGDSDMDVVAAAYDADEIAWYENTDGSGTSWTKHVLDSNYGAAHSVYTADVDGDGDLDFFGAATDDDDVNWWENDDGSGGSWTKRSIDPDIGSPWWLIAEDITEDGDMDVVVAAVNADLIRWYENDDGAGGSWVEHTVAFDFDGAASTWSADVNGDGNLDILGAAYLAQDIAWWDLTEYESEGMLESSILDVQEQPSWDMMDWTSTEPAGTMLGFQVRASTDSANMGPWSDTLTSPGSLSGVVSDQDSLFQYLVIMQTEDPGSTPVLDSVSVSWMPWTGIEGETGTPVGVFALHGAVPNPARGVALVRFSLPEEGPAELLVYDVAGRVVSRNADVLPAGRHQIELEGLATGVYLVRLSAGNLTATERFVVTR